MLFAMWSGPPLLHEAHDRTLTHGQIKGQGQGWLRGIREGVCRQEWSLRTRSCRQGLNSRTCPRPAAKRANAEKRENTRRTPCAMTRRGWHPASARYRPEAHTLRASTLRNGEDRIGTRLAGLERVRNHAHAHVHGADHGAKAAAAALERPLRVEVKVLLRREEGLQGIARLSF